MLFVAMPEVVVQSGELRELPFRLMGDPHFGEMWLLGHEKSSRMALLHDAVKGREEIRPSAVAGIVLTARNGQGVDRLIRFQRTRTLDAEP